MKRSGIMLLSGAGFIILILLALTVFIRIKLNDFMEFSGNPLSAVTGTGVQESRTYGLKDFDSLRFENMWNVVIREGREFSITVEADKALLDVMNVVQSGKEVSLSYDRYLKGVSPEKQNVRAEIVLPDLENLVFTGMGQVSLENLVLDNLVLDNSGASNITARNVSVENLKLKVTGAANAELDDARIRNCDLLISGAASIGLNMNGGELTGEVSGAASVRYSGTVSRESVDVSGIGSLERK